MPVIDCQRLPDLRRGRGPRERAGADPVELARHHAAYVGRPGRAIHQAFPAGALRPPRPRQIRPAQGPLLHGDARPRRARDHGRARHQEGQLVRALDGRHGRHVARRQCAGALRTDGACPIRRAIFADKKGWNDRLALVRDKGVPAFAAPNMERWFTKGFRERDPQAIARMMAMFAATPLDGYLACGEAVRDMDHRDLLPRVKVPTLVIIGRHDPATVPEAGEYIRKQYSRRRTFHDRRGAHFQYRAASAVQ